MFSVEIAKIKVQNNERITDFTRNIQVCGEKSIDDPKFLNWLSTKLNIKADCYISCMKRQEKNMVVETLEVHLVGVLL